MSADSKQIQQLLLNLALNALDVMPHGGILEFSFKSVGDGEVELCVLDTGPGIEPDVLPAIKLSSSSVPIVRSAPVPPISSSRPK